MSTWRFQQSFRQKWLPFMHNACCNQLNVFSVLLLNQLQFYHVYFTILELGYNKLLNFSRLSEVSAYNAIRYWCIRCSHFRFKIFSVREKKVKEQYSNVAFTKFGAKYLDGFSVYGSRYLTCYCVKWHRFQFVRLRNVHNFSQIAFSPSINLHAVILF